MSLQHRRRADVLSMIHASSDDEACDVACLTRLCLAMLSESCGTTTCFTPDLEPFRSERWLTSQGADGGRGADPDPPTPRVCTWRCCLTTQSIDDKSTARSQAASMRNNPKSHWVVHLAIADTRQGTSYQDTKGISSIALCPVDTGPDLTSLCRVNTRVITTC